MPPDRTRNPDRRARRRRAQRAPREAPQEPAETDPRLAALPTAEQIAAEVRRRPVGAVIADICRDLGIMADHPLWRDLRLAIMLHGGNLAGLFRDRFKRARAALREAAEELSAAPGPAPPLALEPACTGPP